MWLRKRAQNFLSPNSGHTRCPSLPPIRVNSHHHRASTAATTTSRVNGQPRVVPIYQVCFVFVFFLSTNAIITSSSTQPSASTTCPHPCPSAFITSRTYSCPPSPFTRVEGQHHHPRRTRAFPSWRDSRLGSSETPRVLARLPPW